MTDDLIASLERRIASLEALLGHLASGGDVDPFKPVFLASRPENKKWAEQTVASGSTTAFIDGRTCTDAKHDCAARQLMADEQILVEVEDATASRYVALRDDAQVVKITANNATGGVYDGKIMAKPADSKFGDLATDIDAIIYNLAELGASTHHVPVNTYYPGVVFGVNSTGKALVAIQSHSTIAWGKATANWTNVAGNGSYVDVNPCADKTGTTPDTGTTVRVYLPRPSTSVDPNVRQNEVVGYTLDANGTAICTTSYLDDAIGTVKMWTDPATVPAGWEIYTTLGAAFPVGYKAADATFGTAGATGGNLTHSHATHATHTSTLSEDPLTFGSEEIQLVESVDGTHDTHSFENHLPPYSVIVFIQRTN